MPYAELHCHTNFSFLDGASAPDELVERAAELGLSALAVTDHRGLYGAVRFVSAAESAGLKPVVGTEIELRDPAVPDPDELVVPARRRRRTRATPPGESPGSAASAGLPARPTADRPRLPGHREAVKEDLRGIGDRQRGPRLVLLARDTAGYRTLCRLISRANLAGTKGVPHFDQALLAAHAESIVALSGGRAGEIGRRLLVGDREGARRVGERYATVFGPGGFQVEVSHHLRPDDDWLVRESLLLARDLGLPVVVTNDVHYARPDDRELHDVLTAIRHGRTLDTLGHLRRPHGEAYLKSADELLVLPPGDGSLGRGVARAWADGIERAAELAASTAIDLGFEQYRFPGFAVPEGETPFSYLSQLCWDGARRRYHPMTPSVVRQLAHELDVIEKTGLAEFFLICWDLMEFARSRKIPAQGRGSAADSIVAYVLGITRVDPIRHNLLFERFINEGRTAYPDVDIDFSSERREEVIQYVYSRYGPEHTGMVCNLVTYRARSAVREVGYALGFPRPLVDRVAKALETYDSVMVRRDLEADGGFGEFFRRPGEGEGESGPIPAAAPELTEARGLTDPMGQLRHARGGRIATAGSGESGNGRLPRREDAARVGDLTTPPLSPPMTMGSSYSGQSGRQGGSDASVHAREAGGRALPASDSAPYRRSSPGYDGGSVTERDKAGRATAGAGGRAAPPPVSPPMPLPAAYPAQSGPQAASGASIHARAGGGRAWPSADLASYGRSSQGFAAGSSTTTDKESTEVADAPPRADFGHLPATVVRGGPEGTLGAVSPVVRAGGPTTTPANGLESGAPTTPIGIWPNGSTGELEPGNGTWDVAAGSAPAIRPGGRGDDEGGPGDSPASVAWLRAGRGTGYEAGHAPPTVDGRRLDPETGELEPPDRRTDKLGRILGPMASRSSGGGSTRHLSDWERWLEFCARIDGFPRHLSIHSGGMLVTAAPLIDIAPLERATMKDRVVAQYDKRDVETLKLIKLDLLGLGMLAAIDETVQLIEHDCAVCLDLDRLPEEIPEVFAMLQAADTVGVFQVESRAQMQTLPKSRPQSLDDLVVEVAIIRPGPIQGNAVHPYLRRKQGLEPVTYAHPTLEPILGETLGVILYQEQVMKIAIDVAGFTPADSDGFRRAMGTWRSTREMEKLHRAFVEGCLRQPGMDEATAEELFGKVAAFASFGFAKSHAAAFARTAYESAFLKLFYPAQFLVGLINAQPMGFYPVEVLVNDAKRHGVAVLPPDINASAWRTTTEWVGPDGGPAPVRSPACVMPSDEARRRWTPEVTTGWGVRLGLHLVKGIGEQHEALLDAERARGPYTSLADVVERTALPEEVVERLIRVGALDSLGRPRRELLWQLREVAGSVRAAVPGPVAGRPMDLRLPATDAPALPALTEVERLGDAYAVVGLDARRQVVELFRPALERLGAVTNAALASRPPGPVRIGGLVVTRQHPMTARGTVFLALEDETGMVNVTLWPDTWQRLRGVVRRHALLLVDGELQREASVVNVVAHEVRALPEIARPVGGPDRPDGVRQIGQAGMRRLG